MDDFNIPGVDRGALVASFAGAMAYLCAQDKLPVVRAIAYLAAGTATAVYLGPGLIEWLHDTGRVELGEKARYATIFITGVAGVWLLNLLIALLQAARDRAGRVIDVVLARLSGNTPQPPAQPYNVQPPPQQQPFPQPPAPQPPEGR